jgi:hypothetical protein
MNLYTRGLSNYEFRLLVVFAMSAALLILNVVIDTKSNDKSSAVKILF